MRRKAGRRGLDKSCLAVVKREKELKAGVKRVRSSIGDRLVML